MTKKQKAARIAAIKELLEANGFKLNPRYGHYYKILAGSDSKGRPISCGYRAKFQATSLRIEKQGLHGQWFNMGSDYFSKIDPQAMGPVVRAIAHTNEDNRIIRPSEGQSPKKGLSLSDIGL